MQGYQQQFSQVPEAQSRPFVESYKETIGASAHNYALGLKSEDYLSKEELNEIPLEDW